MIQISIWLVPLIIVFTMWIITGIATLIDVGRYGWFILSTMITYLVGALYFIIGICMGVLWLIEHVQITYG